MGESTTVTIYPISNYSFGSKPPKQDKDNSVAARYVDGSERWVVVSGLVETRAVGAASGEWRVASMTSGCFCIYVGNFPWSHLVEGNRERTCRLDRLKQQYATKGIRHSVDALPIVYEHGHPHVLIFQIGMSYFKLPGGRLRPGESDHDGLLRKLDTNLAPDDAKLKPDWRIGTCWRVTGVMGDFVKRAYLVRKRVCV